ncbi:MAG: alpha-1,4-glucan--maltose-1-phosphate maltosyltransferase [Bryobacteraceae bacterium]
MSINPLSISQEGRRRVVIESVHPEVDCGRFPVKRTAGEKVTVEADVFGDGHDALACVLLYRKDGAGDWIEMPMRLLANDRWRGEFEVAELGCYQYTIEAWVDHFQTWRRDLMKRLAADQDVSVDLLIGARWMEEAASRARGADEIGLREGSRQLREPGEDLDKRELALNSDLADIMRQYPDRRFAVRYGKELSVTVDRPKARYSTWYEMFPRSSAAAAGAHGTFCDCERRLDYVAGMGFDVLYLPPIHPIGRTFRKGRNNVPTAGPDDVGSPWAIGSEEGGHKAIHPALGTMEDFERLVAAAAGRGIEIALDIAFQVTPDHPWVREHPEWFRKRPDGSIQYAENPPKKYQDIYPIDFETPDWKALWEELRSVFLFWAGKGVRIFRVDNPHTKAFPFWEWVIGEVRRKHPGAIFLAEAFTRPKVMYRLAKLGFTQSYTYFAWRNTKPEITQYFTELTQSTVREFFRPNLWPNTPDILPEYLQFGGRPAFIARLILAATLGASYGIYGPAFELCDNAPREPGSEEYLHSEKYEIRQRNLDDPWSLKDIVTRINRARRENAALQYDHTLRFHDVDNEMLICYSKIAPDGSSAVLVVANLDFNHTHSGWVNLHLDSLGVDHAQPFQVHDLLGEGRFLWQGSRNFVELDPKVSPAHVFRIRRKTKTERDFDYYL